MQRLTCILRGAACLDSLSAGKLHAVGRGTAGAVGSHHAIAVAGVLPAAAIARAVRAVGLAVQTAAAACTSPPYKSHCTAPRAPGASATWQP